MARVMKKADWPHKLFVEYASFYFPVLESMKEQAKTEVDSLCKILEEHRVPKGSRILDLFCGIGRHSINLAKRGYEVVGYDPSPYFLKKAKEWTLSEDLEQKAIKFYRGPPTGVSRTLLKYREDQFKVILMLGTTLGYFQQDNDLQILRSIRAVTSPGCLLVTETENRDWRLKNFQPYVDYSYKRVFIHENWKVNLETSVFEGESYYYRRSRNGRHLTLAFKLIVKMRLYSLHEVVDMLDRAGWKFIRSYDGLRGSSHARSDSPDLLTVNTIRKEKDL